MMRCQFKPARDPDTAFIGGPRSRTDSPSDSDVAPQTARARARRTDHGNARRRDRYRFYILDFHRAGAPARPNFRRVR
jgi:hypothetical protein